MPATTLQTEAFVLAKRPSTADGWLACTLFSPEHGPLHALQRIPKKPTSGQILLDIFDEANLTLESSNQGRTWFVREIRLAVRHDGIGKSYSALVEASAFAKLITRNAVSPDSRPAVAQLLKTAFASFASAARPDIVGFKCLYVFARDEGYPVKQEWFAALHSENRDIAALLLNRPLAEQTTGPEEVRKLRLHLEDYLRGHTEIIVD